MPIVVTRSRSLFNDVDGDGQIDSGDTLFHRITVTNTNAFALNNVVINDALPGQTIVAGTLNVSPIAFDDSFTAVGNTALRVGGAANIGDGPSSQVSGNLLTNDREFFGDSFTIGPVTGGSSANGGTFNIFSDGSFNYISAAGFEGADTFTYTIRDDGIDGVAGNADDLSSTGLVTIAVGGAAGQVWYVDAAAAAGGTGTSARPFNSLAPLNNTASDPDGTGDTIYVKGAATGPIVLEASQSLAGTGAALVVGGFTLAGAGANSSVTASTGTTVTLATGNTLSGISILGTGGATGLIGINFGTLTVANALIDTAGQAIGLATGTVTGSGFTSTDSDGGANNISLSSIAGTLNLGGGALSGSAAASAAVRIVGGTGTIDYNGTVGKLTDGLLVDVSNKTGGTVSLDGAITGNNLADGIALSNNTGATINLTGALSINSQGSNSIAFSATGGGTVTAMNATNTVDSGANTAVNIQNTTIGTGGVNFQSVSSAGGTNTGIVLINAGSGGFTITGTGSVAASGGVIGARTGADGGTTVGNGIYIQNTNNISLSNLTFQNAIEGFGIRGVGVNNFTLRDSAFTGTYGTSDVANLAQGPEGAVSFTQLTGTALFEGNDIGGGRTENLRIVNTSGALNLTVRDSASDQAVFDDLNIAGNDAMLVDVTGAGGLTLNVTGVEFRQARGDMLQVNAGGSSVQTITVANNSFHNAHADIVSGGGGVTLSGGGDPSSYNVTYAVTGNSFRGAEGNALSAFYVGSAGTVRGTILNNVIGIDDNIASSTQATRGSLFGEGIFVGAERFAGTGTLSHAVRIENNQVRDIAQGLGAISLRSNGEGSTGGTVLEATIRSNVVEELGANHFAGIYAIAGGTLPSGDFGRMGLDIQGNNISLAGNSGGGNAIVLDQISSDARYYLPGYAGSANGESFGGTASANIASYLAGRGNTLVNGLSPSRPGSTVDATQVRGVTGAALTQPVAAMVETIEPIEPTASDEIAGEIFMGTGGTTGDAPAPSVSQNPSTADASQPIVVDDGVLSAAELSLIVDAAIGRWADAGATPEQIAAMRAVTVDVADLAGNHLGSAVAGAITVDADAAGFRWFVDATPNDDAEYAGEGTQLAATGGTQAATRIDLLTVIMHELGHQIGLADEHQPGDADALMHGTINPGERRLPGAGDADAAGDAPVTGAAFALAPIAIGTLPAGRTLTVDFRTTVDAFRNQTIPFMEDQATVTSSNGGSGSSTPLRLTLDSLTLSGTVYADANRNGRQDAGEGPVTGQVLRVLYADNNGSGVLDAGDTEVLRAVGEGGAYEFAGLAPGDYIVALHPSNFAAGGSQVGKVSPVGDADPDDDVDGDDNGYLAPAGTPAGDGAIISRAITLAHDTETTADSTGKRDINTTLDFALADPNRAPTIANLQGDAVTYTEDVDTSVRIDGGSNAIAADPDSANFNGGSLTASVTGGFVAAKDRIGIFQGGGVATTGGNVTVNGVLIGTVTGNNSTGTPTLVLTFTTDDATPARVQEVVRALFLGNGSQEPVGGTRVITVTLVDGDGTAGGGADRNSYTTSVNVVSINDAPGGADRTLGLAEDGFRTLAASDFGFVDHAAVGSSVEGQSLLAVRIATLPGAGTLYIDTDGAGAGSLGTPVVAGQSVSAADIAAGRLVFVPAANGNGAGYAGFTFQVRDDGGTANGGVDTDATANTLTFDVAAVNDAPVNSVPGTQNGSEDVAITFSVANGNAISVSDPDAAAFAITVRLSIADGALTPIAAQGVTVTGSGTNAVTLTGSQAAINAALDGLTYAPPAEASGTRTLTIATDDGGNTGGPARTDTDAVTITIAPVDDAAVARPDAKATDEATIVTGNVFVDNGSGADSDIDGPALSVAAVNGSAAAVGQAIRLSSGAMLTLRADGGFAYDPAGAFNTLTGTGSGAVNTAATDSFTYTLAGGGTTTVTITVNGIVSDDDELAGGVGNDTIVGTPGADFFRLDAGGDDAATGLAGVDAFYFGGAMTRADRVNGGAGDDQVGLQGDYANLVLGAGSLDEVETLVLLPGSDNRFGGASAALHDYAITTEDGLLGADRVLTVNMNTLRSAEDVVFDGRAETDGSFLFYGGQGNDVLIGGQRSDGFYFGGGGRFGTGDRVDGQAGEDDQLGLQGDYAGGRAVTFGATQIAGIETLVLLTAGDARFGGGSSAGFSYDLTTSDGNVAAGATLVVNANTLRAGETLTFNGSAETNGAFDVFGGNGADDIRGGAGADLIIGRGGADALRGGAGDDVFAYLSVSDSTGTDRDAILDFAVGDRLDLSAIDAIAGTGANDAFSFIGANAFGRVAGELRAERTNGATWTVQADTDGDGVSDLEFVVVVQSGDPLTLNDFIV